MLRIPACAFRALSLVWILLLSSCASETKAPDPSPTPDQPTQPTQPITPPTVASREEAASVRAAWTRYERALEMKDGAVAASSLTDPSFAFYTNLVRLAVDGTQTEVEPLPPSSLYEVLSMRQRCTRAQLAGMDGRQYVVFATNSGWYVGNDPTRLEKITVGNNTAAAIVKHPTDTSKTYQFFFRRPSGSWLFEWSSAQQYFNDLYAAEAQSRGVAIKQLVLDMVAQDSGQPIKPT